jgi:adenine-specific DNA-methyltransferase
MKKRDYSKLNRSQLLEIVEKLDGEKEYGLVWDAEREPETVVTMCEDNLPILSEVKSKEVLSTENDINHILIEGDNYHSLSVLNYTHRGKIDLIYIDPPYNTGKPDEFLYNDRYVDENDTYRHSKWLTFMEKRLNLASELLRSTGAIFISIDDNEIAQLKMLGNKVFGEENFVAQFIRKNKAGAGHDSGQVAIEFDYMLCYAKSISELNFQKEVLDVENDAKYKLTDAHVKHRGKYYLRDLDYKGSYSESGDYPIKTPGGNKIYAGGKFGKPNTWRWSKDKVEWGIKNDFIVFNKKKDDWKIYIKQYQFVDNENNLRERQLPYRALIQFLNSEGSQELNSIVDQNIFKFPKPIGLVTFCLKLFKSKEITVLDFFAGSGTTGHATLKLNNADGGKRKFIICTNNENEICEKVTHVRIKKAIKGYAEKKTGAVKPLGGNLKYFKTGYVKNNRNRDQLKIDITKRCTEMLCLKEGIYNQKKETSDWKIFEQTNKYMAVYYDFASDTLDDLKKEMNKLKGEKVLYCFTVDPQGLDSENFSDWKNIRLEPIPQKILDVYKSIFNNK